MKEMKDINYILLLQSNLGILEKSIYSLKKCGLSVIDLIIKREKIKTELHNLTNKYNKIIRENI